jgi:hypothetical protein
MGAAVRLQGNNLGAAPVATAIKMARRVRHGAGGVFLAVTPENADLLA